MSSPLMKLPAELRNNVYEFVIGEIKVLKINQHGCFAGRPALLGTCKQIRSEALPIFEHMCGEAAKGSHMRLHSLKFHVHNFDFQHVQAFQVEHRMPPLYYFMKWTRKLRVVLTMDGDGTQQAKANLEEWLRHLKGKLNGGAADYWWYGFASAVPAVPKELDKAFGKPSRRVCKDHGTLKLQENTHMEWAGIRDAWVRQQQQQQVDEIFQSGRINARPNSVLGKR